MAKVTVAHHPELTVETAMEVFRTHFGERYDVYSTKPLVGPTAIVVKKSGRTAVRVILKQGQNDTTFVLFPFAPSAIFNLLFMGLITVLFLRPSWKAMEDEVRLFIENASEFR